MSPPHPLDFSVPIDASQQAAFRRALAALAKGDVRLLMVSWPSGDSLDIDTPHNGVIAFEFYCAGIDGWTVPVEKALTIAESILSDTDTSCETMKALVAHSGEPF